MQKNSDKRKKNPIISYLAYMFAAVLILILLSYLAQNRNHYVVSQDEEQAAVYVLKDRS